VFENRTAAMLEPYLDADGRPTGNHGIGMLGPDELARILTAPDGQGFDVHVHAIGDRAVRDTLDAVQAAARANGPRDARHQIAHLQFVPPTTVPASAAWGWWPTPSRSGPAWTAPCAS
jgi:predicted amidohydrolase YtcJ